MQGFLGEDIGEALLFRQRARTPLNQRKDAEGGKSGEQGGE